MWIPCGYVDDVALELAARKMIQASLNGIREANTKFVRRSAGNLLQHGDYGDGKGEMIFTTGIEKIIFSI
jgi:hypothetical protein